MSKRKSTPCVVSFIIAARNAEEYIREAVDSALTQTLDDIEVIVCDDGSTDGTVAQLEKYKDDPRVVLVRNATPRRAAHARNRCLEVASGEFIAVQDADDRSHPRRAEVQSQFLENNPEYAIVGSKAAFFDDRGIWGYSRKVPVPSRKELVFNMPFVHTSVMFRADALRSVNGYRVAPETRRAEDYDLILRLYARGFRGRNLPDHLSDYRVDERTIARRKYRYRLDEAVVRARGFHSNQFGLAGIVFTLKPLFVGLVPSQLLHSVRKRIFGSATE